MSEAKMPDCPKCGSNEKVEASKFPKEGSHYCPCGHTGPWWFISQEAARDLLEALKAMEAVITESDGVAGYHLNGEIAKWDEFGAVSMLRAAIEKAEGR